MSDFISKRPGFQTITPIWIKIGGHVLKTISFDPYFFPWLNFNYKKRSDFSKIFVWTADLKNGKHVDLSNGSHFLKSGSILKFFFSNYAELYAL